MNKITTIDLFSGCGGLLDGFEQDGHYETLAAVEWEPSARNTLAKRLKQYAKYPNAEEMTLLFDMQRHNELFAGWLDDPKYGTGLGLDKLIGNRQVDVVVGGPPCQAYSIAGRIRDANGMRDDYRNFLFESYAKVIERYKPKAFIFENVPGLLSARPTGEPITKIIIKSFHDLGYSLVPNLKDTMVDMADFGLPQRRQRLIIVGLSDLYYKEEAESLLSRFYREILPKYKVARRKTVKDALYDLPKLYPLSEPVKVGGKKFSHDLAKDDIPNHLPRFHSFRDIGIFRLLTNDLRNGKGLYAHTEALKRLYTEMTGKVSNVHKYHVLREDLPSNLIPAHLFKDGLRHIHPDPEQARTITVREAARLQGFPDDFIFYGSQGDQYKMIGNAVPPYFSKIIAKALRELLFENY